ncbi:arsenosugar biosynthesis radical SAM (seleno)protein ArsS [Nitrosococcus watsonii]|uniref:Radical SAM domain protein n=1 Tax=Nitrosococcus watsoni (strain C-113) TaxID=105559 RepID=D8KBX7_NITWC|nr:arsenosugar biosynthesis radical SAM (seleno)protein ArsS [Nitrosococcus watsonii]ADJ27738.1 Radical SAM domain protein [Nitrosococcus watsonii C-113]
MHATLPLLQVTDFPALKRKNLEAVQVNLGYRCNQQCVHCHVGASPHRKEVMTQETIEQVVAFLQASNVTALDLTGGAPELNPYFRDLVTRARDLGIRVVDRCNLTILEEPGQGNLAKFLADQKVEIVASLPCYLEENVNRQRGRGVFEASIRALQALNCLGYGDENSALVLNLVYNPQGATLPPPQGKLEAEYKRQLRERYGIAFNNLFSLTNMPIQRFGSMLVSKGIFGKYMALLREAHQAENLASVMCRKLISVDWQGYVYDCDFNQMLGLSLVYAGKSRLHLSQLMEVDLAGNPIAIADHCYGCSAGQGSSCSGALG